MASYHEIRLVAAPSGLVVAARWRNRLDQPAESLGLGADGRARTEELEVVRSVSGRHDGTEQALVGRGGVSAHVLEGGTLRVGDPVEILDREVPGAQGVVYSAKAAPNRAMENRSSAVISMASIFCRFLSRASSSSCAFIFSAVSCSMPARSQAGVRFRFRADKQPLAIGEPGTS